MSIMISIYGIIGLTLGWTLYHFTLKHIAEYRTAYQFWNDKRDQTDDLVQKGKYRDRIRYIEQKYDWILDYMTYEKFYDLTALTTMVSIVIGVFWPVVLSYVVIKVRQDR